MKNLESLFVGGAERACSTALHSYISTHSNIKSFLDKEPSIFNLYDASGEINKLLISDNAKILKYYNGRST